MSWWVAVLSPFNAIQYSQSWLKNGQIGWFRIAQIQSPGRIQQLEAAHRYNSAEYETISAVLTTFFTLRTAPAPDAWLLVRLVWSWRPPKGKVNGVWFYCWVYQIRTKSINSWGINQWNATWNPAAMGLGRWVLNLTWPFQNMGPFTENSGGMSLGHWACFSDIRQCRQLIIGYYFCNLPTLTGY